MSRPEDLLEQKMRALRRPKPVRPTNRPMMTQDLLNYVVNKNNPPYRPTGDWAQTFNEQADAGDLIRKGISAAKEAFIGSPEKLLTGEREQLDTPFGKDVISGMRVAGEPFFLKTAEALAKKMPARATPDQVISIMKGAGKLEELEWSGLLDMMRGKKLVTKDEVMNHLNTKTPKLMERMITEHSRPVPVDLQLGEDGIHRTADGGYFVKPGTANPDIFEVFTTIPHLIGDPQYVGVANNHDEAKDMIGRRMPQAKPQYTDYTMLGGENHREFVVQTPRKAGVGRDYNVPRGHSYGDPDIDRNRIFHTRMNDRIGENGKKILHIEEGQSDWAKAG